MSAYLQTEVKNRIAYLGLSRPEKANAYTQDMLCAAGQFLDSIETQNDVGVLIIHGCRGKHFCAGADRSELPQHTPLDGLKLRARLLFERIANWPTPTIAAVNGSAVGGGFELALACDIRIVSSNAIFAFPEPSLGLIPAAGGCLRSPRLLGTTLAKEMILFGRALSAQEALARGFVSEITEPDKVISRAEAWAARALAHQPLVNLLAKRAINMALPQGDTLAFEGAAQATLYGLSQSATQACASSATAAE